MRGPRFYLALWISKAAAFVIDIIAKGRGTNLPGALALKIDPQFIQHITGIDPAKTVFLTGTNGKSSTTQILHHILTASGHRVISNLGGANMTAGVAVPLLKSCSLTGKLRCDYVVMETDERYVSRIRAQLPAKYLGIANIQKDQVQRNGEPSFIRDKIRNAICADMTVFLNQDEPNTLSLMDASAARTVRYGVGPHNRSFTKDDDFFAVTVPCPHCHSGIAFRRYNLENVGAFRCPVCGFGNDAAPEYLTSGVSFDGKTFTLNGTDYAFHRNLPEFLYSYTQAVAIALELGIPETDIVQALADFRKDSGLDNTHRVGQKEVKFFRMKQENSETLQSVMNSIAADPAPKTLVFGLDEYIDFYPPYINGCYLFDCSFRGLRDSGDVRCICTSPALGKLGILRFLYDGFTPDTLTTLPDSTEGTLSEALKDDQTNNIYLIEEIPFWKQ